VGRIGKGDLKGLLVTLGGARSNRLKGPSRSKKKKGKESPLRASDEREEQFLKQQKRKMWNQREGTLKWGSFMTRENDSQLLGAEVWGLGRKREAGSWLGWSRISGLTETEEGEAVIYLGL